MPVIFLHSNPQDSACGISLDNIAERLTRKNWSSKAIVRLAELDPLYVWINRGERGRVRFYRVCVESHVTKEPPWIITFPSLTFMS